jgi:beta-1,4-mannooligosaccharide phosphorylase
MKSTLDGVCSRSYNEDPHVDGRVCEAMPTAHCLDRSAEFDLVHNHLDWLPLAMSGLCRRPMLTTMHGFGDGRALPRVRTGPLGVRVYIGRRPVAVVGDALALDRTAVAESTRRRFSADRMVADYLAVYATVLARSVICRLWTIEGAAGGTVGRFGGVIRTITLDEPVVRYGGNPILTAHHVNRVWTTPRHRVVTVHNAGVVYVGGETVMLFRSHLRSGISVIGLARSRDGITGWWVEPRPFLQPAAAGDRLSPGVDIEDIAAMEAGGVEDPRINPVDGSYAIT